MNVNLGPTFEKFIEDLVKTGHYQSNSEVVREGLRMLKDQETLRQLKLGELRREIQIGIDQADRGEVAPWNVEEFKAEARKRFAVRKRKN